MSCSSPMFQNALGDAMSHSLSFANLNPGVYESQHCPHTSMKQSQPCSFNPAANISMIMPPPGYCIINSQQTLRYGRSATSPTMREACLCRLPSTAPEDLETFTLLAAYEEEIRKPDQTTPSLLPLQSNPISSSAINPHIPLHNHRLRARRLPRLF
jgi:hypothetical protein